MPEVLLLDGRPEELRTLVDVLAPLGFTLVSASSAEEALTLLGGRDFALIVVGSAEGDSPPIRPDGSRVQAPVVQMREFAELDADRRALTRSEALLRGAFEAAPIGKTVLDHDWRIVRANRAFALLLDLEPGEPLGIEITSLAHPDDREKLASALSRVAERRLGPDDPDRSGLDVHLRARSGGYQWTCAYLSAIDPTELGESLLMIQWVDLSPRRHAQEARAELELEHFARAHAEATAERLDRLQRFTLALESLSLPELLPALALRLAEQFEAQLAEVRIDESGDEPAIVVRAAAGRILSAEEDETLSADPWHETPLTIAGERLGSLRLLSAVDGSFAATDQALLSDLADRAALAISMAQLHEQEHQIAVTLQRGLLPKRLPEVSGLELTAYYEPAGDVGEVGGDWYDAFELDRGRLGIVVGDVAGRGIPAASTMGQISSVTRAFALGDGQTRTPGEVLTRLNRHQLALGAEEMFTIMYAIIDPQEGTVSWANAGHPPPLLHRRSSECLYLEGGDGLMGLDDVAYADRHRLVGEGDTLIFYTDGLVERRREPLDAGLERLARAAVDGPDDPQALCAHLVAALVPPEQARSDDVTIVLARVAGP
jgi:PAS domain S-box-containing protein